MKKWLLAAGLGLALATSAQAADKIAIVNMGSLFQQVAQKTGVSNTLENEFKGRASELQRMETDLQAKMKKLQSMKAGSDRTKLEKDVMAQRQTFAQKAQAFEQDRARRSNELAYLSLINGVGVMNSRLATAMALPPTASSDLHRSFAPS